MISGVEIKPLSPIRDERGWLMEMIRSDEPPFSKFGQVYITSCRKGVTKAWHFHKLQTDYFVCVFGKALVVLYDSRQGSPTFGQVQEVLLADPSFGEGQLLLKIPVGVVHGFTALDSDEARIVNIPDLPYNRASPDEHRYPWNSPQIPYRWPSTVTKGG